MFSLPLIFIYRVFLLFKSGHIIQTLPKNHVGDNQDEAPTPGKLESYLAIDRSLDFYSSFTDSKRA